MEVLVMIDEDIEYFKRKLSKATSQKMKDKIQEQIDILEASKKLSELASKQQPLGKDFEKVLYDNLDDLYVTEEVEIGYKIKREDIGTKTRTVTNLPWQNSTYWRKFWS